VFPVLFAFSVYFLKKREKRHFYKNGEKLLKNYY